MARITKNNLFIETDVLEHELQNLPEELMNELVVDKIIDPFKSGAIVTKILKENGGILTMNKLLVCIYNDTGLIMKRDNLRNLLHKMADKGKLYKVTGTGGLFAISKSIAHHWLSTCNYDN